MSERPTIIVDSDAIARKALASHMDAALELDSVDQLERHLSGPTVVVFGPSLSDAEGIRSAAPILSARPAVGGILISPSRSRPRSCSQRSGPGSKTS